MLRVSIKLHLIDGHGIEVRLMNHEHVVEHVSGEPHYGYVGYCTSYQPYCRGAWYSMVVAKRERERERNRKREEKDETKEAGKEIS